MRTCVLLTSQGTPHGRFQRATEKRQLLAADAAARELGHLSLADALALTVLIAEADVSRYDRAAVRWHGRFELEVKGLGIAEAQLALSALAELRQPGAQIAAATLAKLARLYGAQSFEAALRPLL